MGAGGLRTRTSKHFFFFLFSPKYILSINHFFFSLMQNSYSDNRCHGVSYYSLCATVARAHEPPRDQRIYNFCSPPCFAVSLFSLFPPSTSRSSSPSSVSLSFSFCLTAIVFPCLLPPACCYSLSPLLVTSNFHGRLSPNPPLVHPDFSCRRVRSLLHLSYRSRHSDFFFCFIFFSGDFLLICRTRS